jgi:hypothetical protein
VVKLCTENIFSIGFSCVQRVFVFMLAVYSGRHIPKPVWDKGIKGDQAGATSGAVLQSQM